MKVHNRTFSLIEASIVILVLAVLCATVLVSKKLIEASKVNALYKDILYYKQTIGFFYDTYGSLPGDARVQQLLGTGAENAIYRYNQGDPGSTIGTNFSLAGDGIVIGCDARDGFRQMLLGEFIGGKTGLTSNQNITSPAQCSLLTNVSTFNTAQNLDISADLNVSLPYSSSNKNIGIYYGTVITSDSNLSNTIVGPTFVNSSDVLITLFGGMGASYYGNAAPTTPSSATTATTSASTAATNIGSSAGAYNNFFNSSGCSSGSGSCSSGYQYWLTNGTYTNSAATDWLCRSVASLGVSQQAAASSLATAATNTATLAASSFVTSSNTTAANNASAAAAAVSLIAIAVSSSVANVASACNYYQSGHQNDGPTWVWLGGTINQLLSDSSTFNATINNSISVINTSNTALSGGTYRSPAVVASNPSFPGVSATIAYKLDTKFDDGLPLTGQILSTKGWDATSGSWGGEGGVINATWCNNSATIANANLSSIGYVISNNIKTGCLVTYDFSV